MWKWMGLFLSKNHLLRCWCWLSLLNWIGALIIISIAQTSSKKVGALIRSMTFLSPGAALYLYKSTIRPYCCHIWAGAPSCYLELLEKLQKRIYRTIGPSLAASLELLTNRWNVARLSLFYRYYFGKCSSLFSWEVFSLSNTRLKWVKRKSKQREWNMFCIQIMFVLECLNGYLWF